MKLFTILLVPLLLIQGNDALLRRLKKSPKPEIQEEKESLLSPISQMEESKVQKPSNLYQIPEDYEKTLANVCLYEGISAARDLLGNVPMTQIMEDKELIRNTLNALMPMEMTGFFKIRRQNCMNWILVHFLATEKPTPEIMRNPNVNDKVFELSFAEGFYMGAQIIGNYQDEIPLDMRWPHWASVKLIKKYGLKPLRYGPIMSGLANWHYGNDFRNLFWNLNEDNYHDLVSSKDTFQGPNMVFSIFNEREEFIVQIIKKMKETNSKMYMSALMEALNLATLTGDNYLTNSLLPLLTPEQSYFYGFKVSKQSEKEMATKIFNLKGKKSKINKAMQYFKSLVEFAFVGRNFQLIIDFMKELPTEMASDFRNSLKISADGSNAELFEALKCFD